MLCEVKPPDLPPPATPMPVWSSVARSRWDGSHVPVKPIGIAPPAPLLMLVSRLVPSRTKAPQIPGVGGVGLLPTGLLSIPSPVGDMGIAESWRMGLRPAVSAAGFLPVGLAPVIMPPPIMSLLGVRSPHSLALTPVVLVPPAPAGRVSVGRSVMSDCRCVMGSTKTTDVLVHPKYAAGREAHCVGACVISDTEVTGILVQPESSADRGCAENAGARAAAYKLGRWQTPAGGYL
jgi:hypothetical protein